MIDGLIRLRAACAAFLGFVLVAPALHAQDGNWRITNGGIGSFAGWATQSGVSSLVGDFNGDSRMDVALIRQVSGWATMPVAFADGSGDWSVRNGSSGSFATWATRSGVRPLVGDFDGDGRDDVALLRQANGWATMPVALADGSGGWTVRNGGSGNFATWATYSGVRPLVGDFNGDGRDDVALIRQVPGWSTLPVALAAGDGNWSITNRAVGDFASWATRSGVRPLVGDFDGNGRDDVALVRQASGWGTVPIAFANSSGGWRITNGTAGSFAGWATVFGVRPLVGDFDGNGRDDIALIRQSSGWATLPVAFAAGNGNWSITNRAIGNFAIWATRSGVRPLVGDYNADGRDDVALLRQDPGWATLPVAFAAGNGNWSTTNRTIGSFASWATRSGVQPLVGDFTGDGKTDVALLRDEAGWGTMPLAIGTDQPPITTRALTVARHTAATGNNAVVDTILSNASAVLQTNDGPGDVACPAAFARQGNMTSFTNTDGTLNTSAELQAVFGLAPDMKIVPAVDFCGGRFNTSFIGCGVIGRFNLIIERFAPNQEGILWAHEIGHNVGLPHRADTTDALMFASIGSNRRRINQTECDAFQSGGLPLLAAANPGDGAAVPEALPMGDESTLDDVGMGPSEETLAAMKVDPMMQTTPDIDMPAIPILVAALETGAVTLDAMSEMGEPASTDGMGLSPETLSTLRDDPMMKVASDDSMGSGATLAAERGQTTATFAGTAPVGDERPPVEEFVKQIYFEGLPLVQAAEYEAEDVPVLLEILQNPDEVLYHENAALTLGMIGEEDVVEPLIGYIDSSDAGSVASSGDDTEKRYAAKGRVAAVVALGYAANLANSEAAVTYLTDFTKSAMAATDAGRALADDGLAEYAIIALGFSGAEDAKALLQQITDDSTTRSGGALGGNLGDAIGTSLEISRQVEEEGLLGYYGSSQ